MVQLKQRIHTHTHTHIYIYIYEERQFRRKFEQTMLSMAALIFQLHARPSHQWPCYEPSVPGIFRFRHKKY